MGFWFGSLVFLLLEVVGLFIVKGVYSKQDCGPRRFQTQNKTLLPQVLVATAVFCSWMMWTIVYIGQMYPLVNPVLSG